MFSRTTQLLLRFKGVGNHAGDSIPRDFGAQTHQLTANGTIANVQRRNTIASPSLLLTGKTDRTYICLLPKARAKVQGKMMVAKAAEANQGM